MVRRAARRCRAGWRSVDLLDLRFAPGVELEERELTERRLHPGILLCGNAERSKNGSHVLNDHVAKTDRIGAWLVAS
jgi:hypothetical protein